MRKNILSHRYGVSLLLVVATLAIFSPIGNHEFVWDDRSNVAANPFLRAVPETNVLSFWQGPYQKGYIPLTYAVWAGIAALAGNTGPQAREQPTSRPFHMASLALHTLSVLFVFVILRRLTGHEKAAGAGALLFGLHPLQVEAVSWVSAMTALLSGLLSLVALWQYLRFAAAAGAAERRTRPGFHYGFATCAFVLALLANPAAVAVPVLAWVADYGSLKRPWRQSAKSLAGWFLLGVVFIALNMAAQPAARVDFTATLPARLAMAADALAFYLYKLVLPLGLIADYGRTPALVMDRGWTDYTWILPVALAALLWAWRSQARHFLTAAALFAGGLLPVLGLIPFGFQEVSTVADRYIYLSMLGPALALAWALCQWTGTITTTVAFIVLTALASLSALQTRYWHDDVTLSQHVLERNEKSWLARYYAGIGSARAGALDEAARHFTAALTLKPHYVDAHLGLGNVLAMKGDLDAAIGHYQKALQTGSRRAEVYLNLGNAFLKANRLSEAAEQYEKSLGTQSDNAVAHGNLGHVLFKQNRLGEAVAHYRKALQIDPDAADVHYSLANILAAQGELDRAVEHYRAALRRNASYAGAYYNLGVILAKRGELDDAIRHFRQALAIRPNFADAHESLGKALALQGNADEARKHYQEALRILSAGREPGLGR